MKLLQFLSKYLLSILALFLLIFIPLYPKLPLVDIKNTWVYIRVEDLLVFFVLAIWIVMLARGKISLKTPLTIPILLFWIVGAIATIHGVVIIFPTIANVFPNVALLSYVRHIEYLSLFFIAFSAVKSARMVYPVIWTTVTTLIGVIIYGFGQRYLSFPAYLTMNEEYAKGIPIIISPLNRISSTFAGHYDLAAYLVLILPIILSLIFGFKNYFVKVFLAGVFLLGTVLMFMTVSRVSFFVLFIALFLVFFIQKRILFYIFIPLLVVMGFIFVTTQSSLLARFGSTVKEIDVLVDARTGGAIGHVVTQEREYLYDKYILEDKKEELSEEVLPISIRLHRLRLGIPSHLIAYDIPKKIAVVPAKITSTGETLPQGSGYINLPLSPVKERTDVFFYEYPPTEASPAAHIRIVEGEYLIKTASAYDLSFTTRFQGEWPNALAAYGRNLLVGSGYGSVSLAIDNNYFRMLGETGSLGTLAFFGIFIALGVFLKKNYSSIESKLVKSLVVGLSAGIVGLSLNAILIDVFEASKVAFQLWLLVGFVVGIVALDKSKNFNIYKEMRGAFSSSYAIVIYFLLVVILIFSQSINSYFIGDDFTWFRWAADCNLAGEQCGNLPSRIVHYLFDSEGFFYRPGTKIYFLLLYPFFWLNQVIYHLVSVGLHFIVVTLLYFLALKVFQSRSKAAISGILFLLSSAYLEVVLWISSTGHLFSAAFILASVLLFIQWLEKRNVFLLIGSLLFSSASMLFYEQGVIVPFLCIAYLVFKSESLRPKMMFRTIVTKLNALLFMPVVLYLIVRFTSHSHWSGGDYSYSLIKFPINTIGNLMGYVMLAIGGPMSFPIYEKMRELARSNAIVSVLVAALILVAIVYLGKLIAKRLSDKNKRLVLFCILFFAICLMPFWGFGNISYRYSYMSTFGIIMLLVFFGSILYKHLLSFGKDIAFFVMALIVLVFSLTHLIQTQQTIIDWNGGGGKVEKFLKSLDSLYEESWSSPDVHTQLYFLNVPAKNKNAWVFPWGLSDAVWFAFRNESLEANGINEITDLPVSAYFENHKRVFEFLDDGGLRAVYLDKYGNRVEEEDE